MHGERKCKGGSRHLNPLFQIDSFNKNGQSMTGKEDFVWLLVSNAYLVYNERSSGLWFIPQQPFPDSYLSLVSLWPGRLCTSVCWVGYWFTLIFWSGRG